jgi:hypothetical protein
MTQTFKILLAVTTLITALGFIFMGLHLLQKSETQRMQYVRACDMLGRHILPNGKCADEAESIRWAETTIKSKE